MTDFLSRLAARSVSSTNVARPRLPSLYESREQGQRGDAFDAPGLDGGPGMGAVEPDSVDPDTSSRKSPASQRPEEHRRTPSPNLPGTAPLRPRTLQNDMGTSLLKEDRRARRRDVDSARMIARPIDAAGDGAALLQAAAPVVEVRTNPFGSWPHVGESVAATTGRRDEAPSAREAPVRVHIGRLEVRAIVADPPRDQPKTQPPPDRDALSLSDYLRGRRDLP